MLVHLKICVSRTPSAPHILFSDPHLDGMRASTALKWHPYIVFVHQVLLELVIPYPLSSASIKDNINNNNNNSNNNILSYLCRIETVWKINMVLSDLYIIIGCHRIRYAFNVLVE